MAHVRNASWKIRMSKENMEEQFQRLVELNDHYDSNKNKLVDHLETGYRTFVVSKIF